MGILRHVISEINHVLNGKYGANKAPLVIWGQNNYNSWERDATTGVWYANSSTGFGVHNLWTFLFVPFNRADYSQHDSEYLRKEEKSLYVYSEQNGYAEKGFWSTHRIHPRILFRFKNFMSRYWSHVRIGIHLRSTDRSGELNGYYSKIIGTAKAIYQKALIRGAKRIVFFLSSDSWESIRHARKDLGKLQADVVYFPNISRSTMSNTPLHLQKMTESSRALFLQATNEKLDHFFHKCIVTSRTKWAVTFSGGYTVSCLNASQKIKRRPSYLLAEDCVLEALFLAHSHFYVSMAGNFASGPLLFRNSLPSIQFYPPQVPDWHVHPNMVMVPKTNVREEIVWPCLFEEIMEKVVTKTHLTSNVTVTL